MSEITKPSGVNLIWASGGDKLDPGSTKYQAGWGVELPPRQWENFIQNKQDQAIAHFNQHGIPVWDNVTEYQANKSYVQGTTGTVYRCVQTNVNQNPETDSSNTYWIIAFASAGDFYTKTQANSLYLAKEQNGADIPNVATFRNNIQVYAKSETYTKTEVDTKTTVASALQAQTLTSNTVLITPLQLANAYKGGNQSLTSTGFQKEPGGKMEMWGTATASSSGYTALTFPTAWSVGMYSITATVIGTGSVNISVIFDASSLTTTTINFAAINSSNSFTSNAIYWRATGR